MQHQTIDSDQGNSTLVSQEESEPPSPALPQLHLVHSVVTPRQHLGVEHHRLYPFSIAAKPLFEHYVRQIQAPLSDYTFANNLIWLSQKSGFYQILDECFCLFSLNGDCLTMLLPPLGAPHNQARALKTCFEIMDGYNPTPWVSRVEFVYRDFQDIFTPTDSGGDKGMPIDPEWLTERSLPDYIYRTEDLIGLKGNAYKTKRSEINQFRRAYPDHHMEPLGPQHWDGIRALVDTWLRNRLQYLTNDAIADFFYTVEQERQAIERALAHYDILGLEGLCLLIGDRLEGFTIGERISPDVANILVEKTNFTIPGSAQYLFREFAKTFTGCTYINVGDDLGLENLRRVKMSYRPALFGDKITLKRQPSST